MRNWQRLVLGGQGDWDCETGQEVWGSICKGSIVTDWAEAGEGTTLRVREEMEERQVLSASVKAECEWMGNERPRRGRKKMARN